MTRNNIIQKIHGMRIFNIKTLLMKMGFDYVKSYQKYIVSGGRMDVFQRAEAYNEIENIISELRDIIKKDKKEWNEEDIL